jgi:hypothetical protein
MKEQLIATAQKLLNAYGDTGILRKVTRGSYDPDTGETLDVYDDYEVKVLREEVTLLPNQEPNAALAYQSKITIQTDLDIKEDDILILSTGEQNIVQVTPIGIEDGIVIFELLVQGP